jgi:hypothetical protein
VGQEHCPLILVSTTEELLERKSSGWGLENRQYGRRDQSRWKRGTLYPQKLAVTSPTSACRSVSIVRLRTQATEFRFSCKNVSTVVTSLVRRIAYWASRNNFWYIALALMSRKRIRHRNAGLARGKGRGRPNKQLPQTVFSRKNYYYYYYYYY